MSTPIRITIAISIVAGAVFVFAAIWGPFPSLRLSVLYFCGALLLLLLLFIMWKVPKWQVAAYHEQLSTEQLLRLENEFRKTIAQILGGLAILGGLYFTWQQVIVSEDRQITDRFTRSVEQLGSEQLPLRLGGIYALERIAEDSKRDHWTVMEVLTSFIRLRSPIMDSTCSVMPQFKNMSALRPPEDIQAALTVIGRRKWLKEEIQEQRYLHLHGTDLRWTDLSLGNFENANFDGCNLSGARLLFTKLNGAVLSRACLRGANLWSYLEGVSLFQADLRNAQITGAYLKNASLEQAHLEGLDLRHVHGLSREQIDAAYINEETILSDQLRQELAQYGKRVWQDPRDEKTWTVRLIRGDMPKYLGPDVIIIAFDAEGERHHIDVPRLLAPKSLLDVKLQTLLDDARKKSAEEGKNG